MSILDQTNFLFEQNKRRDEQEFGNLLHEAREVLELTKYMEGSGNLHKENSHSLQCCSNCDFPMHTEEAFALPRGDVWGHFADITSPSNKYASFPANLLWCHPSCCIAQLADFAPDAVDEAREILENALQEEIPFRPSASCLEARGGNVTMAQYQGVSDVLNNTVHPDFEEQPPRLQPLPQEDDLQAPFNEQGFAEFS